MEVAFREGLKQAADAVDRVGDINLGERTYIKDKILKLGGPE